VLCMHDMPGCKYTHLDRKYSIEDLAAFHGHLGPYIVLGYRIGRYAREYFCNDAFEMSAVVHCSGTPPQSCIVDGVQIGSGCTMGKRNIDLKVSDSILCEFTSGGRKMAIRPKPIAFPPRGEDYFHQIEQLAIDMYRADDTELFEVSSR
jgi:formylmethanofuran dehydrogenase subunit E